MVDGLNPQTGNMLRDANTGNRSGQVSGPQQGGAGVSAQERDAGPARPVQDVSVTISAQGAQQSSAEQLSAQAVSDPTATDTKVASTFTREDFGNGAEPRPAVAQNPGTEGPTAGSSNLDPDQAMGTSIDTRV